MEREGNLNILKLGNQFHVTFTRFDGPGGTASPCVVDGRDVLVELLEKLRILPEEIKEALRQLETEPSYHLTVRLSDDERFGLGLVSPHEGLTPG